MRFKDTIFCNGLTLLRWPAWRNRQLIACVAVVLASGCQGNELPSQTGIFRGVAVADEPLAARVAADVLTRGGSAADAAVALYFVLSVTYPSAASLGGGGVCLVSDRDESAVYALSFPAPRPAAAGAAARMTAVPANVRGMAALHARHGQMDWRTVLVPAERIARFGRPLTRASARTLASGAGALLSDPETQQIFAPTGVPPGERELLIQTDLADAIAAVRQDGASGMYSEDLAVRMVAATRQAGGSLAKEDLRNLRPIWQRVRGIEFGNDMAYFAPPPAGAGLLAGQMWGMLADRDRYRRADTDERPHLMVEAERRAWAGRARWLADDGTTVDAASLLSIEGARTSLADYDPDKATSVGDGVAKNSAVDEFESTGFVVVDAKGDAVACTITSYRPFGTGITAPGTGILLAPAPRPEDRNPVSLGPMIVFNPRVGTFKFAAVGGGGPEAAGAMIMVAAESVMVVNRLDRAMQQARVHVGEDGTVLIEDFATAALRDALDRRGHVLDTVPSLGLVNAVYCPAGYPAEQSKILCLAETDPRGFGVVAFPN